MAVQELTPTNALHIFAEAWNRHDMESFAALFARDAQFVNVVGLWWKGAAAIKAAHEVTHKTMFKDSRLEILEVETRKADHNVALTRARWQLSGHIGPAGQTLPPRTGLLLAVLHRHDGKWLIIDAQNTDIVEGVLSRPQ